MINMKKLIYILSFFLLLSGCSKDNNPADPLAKLPPETQTGANTFGCIINGQVFYPRDGTSSLFNPGGKGLKYWGDHTVDQNLYNEIEIRNLKDGKPCSRMIIHIHGLFQNKAGEYVWKSSNFQNSIDGLMQNYVFARIFDETSQTWKFYGSYENSGKVTITRYDLPNRIVSGNFNGKLKLFNGNEEIEIKNGRFDIKWSTLSEKSFP